MYYWFSKSASLFLSLSIALYSYNILLLDELAAFGSSCELIPV